MSGNSSPNLFTNDIRWEFVMSNAETRSNYERFTIDEIDMILIRDEIGIACFGYIPSQERRTVK